MTVLPYKHRLEPFSKHLDQFVIESFGKQVDLDGKTVNLNIAVLGNKGSTEQHFYIQQLSDGLLSSLITFIDVTHDRLGCSFKVVPGDASGDYLDRILLSTRHGSPENKRRSMLVIVTDVKEFAVGALIALFERAVGLYATLVNFNRSANPDRDVRRSTVSSHLQPRYSHQRGNPNRLYYV